MKLNKYFIFSDVHGEYTALREALKEAGYDSLNSSHILVSLGDAFDRGPESRQVFDFLTQHNAIHVKGNHDEFLEEFLDKGADGEFVLFNILHNGLGATIDSFGRRDKMSNIKEGIYDAALLETLRSRIKTNSPGLVHWLKNSPLYFETKHCIFTHAGLDPKVGSNWKNTDKDYMLWDIKDTHKDLPCVNKMVFVGHHHAFRARANAKEDRLNECCSGSNEYWTMTPDNYEMLIKCYGNTDEHRPYIYRNKIAIDGCTNLTHKVNVVVIEDCEETKEEPEEPTVRVTNGTIYSTNGPSVTINMGNLYTTANWTL